MERRLALAMAALTVVACNLALDIRNASGDADSVAFVLITFAVLVASISVFLAKFGDRARQSGQGQRGRGLAPDDAAHGDVRVEGGAAHARGMTGRQSALAMIAISVMACNSALAIDKARHDGGSVALVFVAFAAHVASMGMFLAKFDGGRANGVEQSQLPDSVEGRGVAAHDAAHGDVPVEGGVA
jgi:hypothetical protein